MLFTSGFRTYRFLPLFWRDFYPQYDLPTPETWQRILDELAAKKIGSQYNRLTGVVRFPRPQRLASILAGIPAGRLDDPHVAFFAIRNPMHAAGDELVCLCELTPQNLTAAGRRMAAAVPSW